MSSLAFALVAISLICIFSGVKAHAQNYLNATGLPTFSTTQAVPGGVIDIANGDLHLELPLAQFPQRGAYKLQEKLIYDSRTLGIFDNGTSKVWSGGSGWQFTNGYVNGNARFNATWVPCGSSGYYIYTKYRWTDESGTEHDFPITAGLDNVPPSGCSVFPTYVSGYATDSS